MAYGKVTFEQRIKDNIRNYTLDKLYELNLIEMQLTAFAEMYEVDVLVMDRHGKEVLSVVSESKSGEMGGNESKSVRVLDRTVAKIQIFYHTEGELRDKASKVLDNFFQLMEVWGEKQYLHSEESQYIDELQGETEHSEKKDILTDTWNKMYFKNKMKVVDRSEVLPVALIVANINDWKFANDHFGDDESDRLIQIVADILKKHAKPEYIIGRCDGDVFDILIPMAQDGEAEEYAKIVQEEINEYEDRILAPSVAIGISYKNNVEESLFSLVSDAEYAMFEDKFNIKNSAGYTERLKKGI